MLDDITMNNKLNPDNVHRVFTDCLYDSNVQEKEKANAVFSSAVLVVAEFRPDRLEAHKDDIKQMLNELPDDFKKSKGGGMSFLRMCEDKNGELWTDLHMTCDLLLCLGLATKEMSLLHERDIWAAFPGGVPFVVVNDVAVH
jgi:hypothetical protein